MQASDSKRRNRKARRRRREPTACLEGLGRNAQGIIRTGRKPSGERYKNRRAACLAAVYSMLNRDVPVDRMVEILLDRANRAGAHVRRKPAEGDSRRPETRCLAFIADAKLNYKPARVPENMNSKRIWRRLPLFDPRNSRGAGAASRWAVGSWLVCRALKIGKCDLHASERELEAGIGVCRDSIRVALKCLVSYGWIEKLQGQEVRGQDGSVYRIRRLPVGMRPGPGHLLGTKSRASMAILDDPGLQRWSIQAGTPSAGRRETASGLELALKTSGRKARAILAAVQNGLSHDLWSSKGLGKGNFQVFVMLRAFGPVSTRRLQGWLGLKKIGQVRAKLRRLADLQLAIEEGVDLWTAGEADFDRLAEQLGCSGCMASVRARHEADRKKFKPIYNMKARWARIRAGGKGMASNAGAPRSDQIPF